MSAPITNSSAPKTVRRYDVIVRYTVQSASIYEVFAESEESAMNIARYRLAQDRRDYAEMRDITTEIKKPQNFDENLSVCKSWGGV